MAPRNNSTMLRSRRRDANVKPNRRLDKKSSRGMLFENEELRMRTITINEEVEKGQSDIKKLRRENEQLRREIWGLRDEYDRLEEIVEDLKDEDETDTDQDESDVTDEGERDDDDEGCLENPENLENAEKEQQASAAGGQGGNCLMAGNSAAAGTPLAQGRGVPLKIEFDGLSIVDEETDDNQTPSNDVSMEGGNPLGRFNMGLPSPSRIGWKYGNPANQQGPPGWKFGNATRQQLQQQQQQQQQQHFVFPSPNCDGNCTETHEANLQGHFFARMPSQVDEAGAAMLPDGYAYTALPNSVPYDPSMCHNPNFEPQVNYVGLDSTYRGPRELYSDVDDEAYARTDNAFCEKENAFCGTIILPNGREGVYYTDATLPTYSPGGYRDAGLPDWEGNAWGGDPHMQPAGQCIAMLPDNGNTASGSAAMPNGRVAFAYSYYGNMATGLPAVVNGKPLESIYNMATPPESDNENYVECYGKRCGPDLVTSGFYPVGKSTLYAGDGGHFEPLHGNTVHLELVPEFDDTGALSKEINQRPPPRHDGSRLATVAPERPCGEPHNELRTVERGDPASEEHETRPAGYAPRESPPSARAVLFDTSLPLGYRRELSSQSRPPGTSGIEETHSQPFGYEREVADHVSKPPDYEELIVDYSNTPTLRVKPAVPPKPTFLENNYPVSLAKTFSRSSCIRFADNKDPGTEVDSELRPIATDTTSPCIDFPSDDHRLDASPRDDHDYTPGRLDLRKYSAILKRQQQQVYSGDGDNEDSGSASGVSLVNRKQSIISTTISTTVHQQQQQVYGERRECESYRQPPSYIRLNSIRPHTLVFVSPHADLTVQEVIDALDAQIDAELSDAVRGVRVINGHCYICLATQENVGSLLESGLRVRDCDVILEDVSRGSVIVALEGIPHHVTDTAVAVIMSNFGTVIGEVERRLYKGVDTGERLLRLKPGGHVSQQLPAAITVAGGQVKITVLPPHEVHRLGYVGARENKVKDAVSRSAALATDPPPRHNHITPTSNHVTPSSNHDADIANKTSIENSVDRFKTQLHVRLKTPEEQRRFDQSRLGHPAASSPALLLQPVKLNPRPSTPIPTLHTLGPHYHPNTHSNPFSPTYNNVPSPGNLHQYENSHNGPNNPFSPTYTPTPNEHINPTFNTYSPKNSPGTNRKFAGTNAKFAESPLQQHSAPNTSSPALNRKLLGATNGHAATGGLEPQGPKVIVPNASYLHGSVNGGLGQVLAGSSYMTPAVVTDKVQSGAGFLPGVHGGLTNGHGQVQLGTSYMHQDKVLSGTSSNHINNSQGQMPNGVAYSPGNVNGNVQGQPGQSVPGVTSQYNTSTQNIQQNQSNAVKSHMDHQHQQPDVPSHATSSVPNSPLGNRRQRLTKKLLRQRSSDELVPPPANQLAAPRHQTAPNSPNVHRKGGGRGPRKMSNQSTTSNNNLENAMAETEKSVPNATSSPIAKHNHGNRKLSVSIQEGQAHHGTNIVDVSRSSSSGQDSPTKVDRRRRVSVYFNNKKTSRRSSSVVALGGGGGRYGNMSSLDGGNNEQTTTCSERERTNSVSSRGSSIGAIGKRVGNKGRRASLRTLEGRDNEKVPWCGCWGNGCI